jgi:hypothetical protein
MNVQRIKRMVPRPLWPYLGATRRLATAIPPLPLLYKKRLLSDPSLTAGERELLSKVSSRIYYPDGMYNEGGAHYYEVGLSAIQCIDEALARANLQDIRTILDLPSGSGRVLRFLSVRFPKARITACDIQRGAVDFCGERLGADKVYSSANPDKCSSPDGRRLAQSVFCAAPLGRSPGCFWARTRVTKSCPFRAG